MRLLMVTPWTRLVKKAINEGHEVVVIWNKEERSTSFLPEIFKLADETFVFDISNTAKLRRRISEITRNEHIDYVWHLGREETMLETYTIANDYNMALNTVESIRSLNNKLETRMLLQNHGLSTIRFEFAKNVDGVFEYSLNFGFPFIVKPTELSGSRGVYLCNTLNDIVQWETIINKLDYSGPFLMEEYLFGPEVSVETLSVNGTHKVIGITDKIKTSPPTFVEIGHIHPSRLPDSTKAEIELLVTRFLDASGYKFGPAHTEVIVTESGPKIVESQARFGGDRIPELVELATGIDMESSMFSAINGGTLPEIQRTNVAMIRYLNFEPGRISDVGLKVPMESFDYVFDFDISLKAGDEIPVLTSSRDRYGHIIVTAEYHHDVEERLRSAMENIVVYR